LLRICYIGIIAKRRTFVKLLILPPFHPVTQGKKTAQILHFSRFAQFFVLFEILSFLFQL